MRRKTEASPKQSKSAARRREVNLSRYRYLHMSFVNEKGAEVVTLEFSHDDVEDSFQMKIDAMGPTGDSTSTFTVVDLDV